MPFRRKFRRGFGRRRRRPLPETFTIVECSSCTNMAANATCSGPITDLMPVMLMSFTKSFSDSTEIVSPERKSIVVDAVKFTSEHGTVPFDWNQCNALPPNPDIGLLNFIVTIWECLIVLPLAEGTTNIPAFVPILTDGFLEVGDIANRVLWKRIMILNMIGPNPSLVISDNDHTLHYQGSGPVVVKSKVRLDDRHGLFYARNFTHNVVFPATSSEPPCTLDCDTRPNDKSIPVINDSWWKVFYHGSQR